MLNILHHRYENLHEYISYVLSYENEKWKYLSKTEYKVSVLSIWGKIHWSTSLLVYKV